ncbi:MAG: SufE family protein [Chitinophagales bacterium]
MPQAIKDIEAEIVEEFGMFEDPMDRYDYIIDLGKEMPELEDKYKTDDRLVKGCQSKVWLHAFEENGLLELRADSNTVITKGIIALLLRVFSGQKPEDVVNAELEFIDKIGLKAHLSPQRSNGLNAMIKQIKLYALALNEKAKLENE